MLDRNLWIYLGIFLVSFMISATCTPMLRRLAIKFEIVDKPNQSHKTHSSPVPYLGGFAIIIPVLLLSTFALVFLQISYESKVRGLLLVIPGLILAIVGLIDDKENLSASSRLLIQVSLSFVISIVLIQGDFIVQITDHSIFNFLLSSVWIVGITNAFNFLDNLDGGAVGVTVISSAFIFIMAWSGNQYLIASFSIVLCAASFAFLFWNKTPARIYLGDSGALFIGLMFSVLLLQFEPSTTERLSSIAVPIMMMAVPIMDSSVAVLSRLRRGSSIFKGGRDHLSHRLLYKGFSRNQTALSLWFITVFFTSISLLISNPLIINETLLSISGLILMITMGVLFFRLPHL